MDNSFVAYEVIFCKYWTGRFLSQIDTMRSWARALRRTGMPVYYTQGFNPRPKLSYITPPLVLGQTSQCERIGFRMDREVLLERLSDELTKHAPTGTAVLHVQRAPDKKFRPTQIQYLFLVSPDPDNEDDFQMDELLAYVPDALVEPPQEITLEQCSEYKLTFSDKVDPVSFFEKAFLFNIRHSPEGGSPTKLMGAQLAARGVPFHFHRIRCE